MSDKTAFGLVIVVVGALIALAGETGLIELAGGPCNVQGCDGF